MKDIFMPILGVLSTLAMLTAPYVSSQGVFACAAGAGPEGVAGVLCPCPEQSASMDLHKAEKGVTATVFFSSSCQTGYMKG